MGWIEGVVISFMADFRFCFGARLFLSLVEVTSVLGRGCFFVSWSYFCFGSQLLYVRGMPRPISMSFFFWWLKSLLLWVAACRDRTSPSLHSSVFFLR